MSVRTPTLIGKKIRLEPMTLEHLHALEAIAFDQDIWRYMIEWVQTREALQAWMSAALKEEAAGTGLPWVTVLQESNRVIGSTRLTRIDWRHQRAEIGHTWLTADLHGSGLNTEAKLLQLRYAFDELHLARVAFRTHHENLRSQAAIRKLGATYEGTSRNHYIMPDGTRRHTVWFSITREEWPEIRSRLERRLAEGVPHP